jgi:phosphohistidine phosphatase SixA
MLNARARPAAQHSGGDMARGSITEADVAEVAQRCRGSIALVGHLPFLDRLASLLITDDENTHVIQFRMGGLVKLVPKSEDSGFTVA